MSFDKVLPGQPLSIRAQTWNAILESADAFQNQKRLQSATGGVAGNSNIVFVKNSTDEDLKQFQIVGLGDPLNLPDGTVTKDDFFKKLRAFDGVLPAVEDHVFKFAITAEPIKKGQIGKAIFEGLSPVKLNVDSEDDIRAGIEDDNYETLKTGTAHGCEIIYKEEGTGEKWGLVYKRRVMPINGLLGEAQATIASGASGLIKEITTDETDRGNSFSAKNMGSQSVSSGDNLIWGVDRHGNAFFFGS